MIEPDARTTRETRTVRETVLKKELEAVGRRRCKFIGKREPRTGDLATVNARTRLSREYRPYPGRVENGLVPSRARDPCRIVSDLQSS